MKTNLRSENVFIGFVFIGCFVLLTRLFDQERKYLTSSDKLTFKNIGEMRMSCRFTFLMTIIFYRDMCCIIGVLVLLEKVARI